jgi:DNA-binding IclR family transcriptional regulator
VAHLPAEERRRLAGAELAMLTGETVVDPLALLEQLERVTAVGYAVESGEAAIGDAGIAAPVLDRDGVVGAIGLVGPVERLLDDERRDEYAVAVRETARMLARELGAARPAVRRFVAEAS